MLKREAENELRNAAPALEAANRAVDSLDKNDVADLKQTKNPTAQTEVALKCILLRCIRLHGIALQCLKLCCIDLY